jgi:hypothetical protein
MLAPGSIVASGDIAVHDDGGQHWAVVLDVTNDECEALFFTSNPSWAERTRRATREELAMAGYVTTRPTYLAYVVRSSWDFIPVEGRNFPTHWIEALRQEFRPIQGVRQIVGT